MQCLCGCGADVPNKLVSVQIEAGKVALELLAWDRMRTTGPQSGEIEDLISRGAECYQRLLATLHGGEGPDPLPRAEEWLDDSLAERDDRPDMTEKGGLLKKTMLRITKADIDQLNRERPELSFSGEAGTSAAERAEEDPVAQLRGLRELHAVGALTDEEFSEAKAKVIKRLG